jgi:hypothetical protein
VGTSHHRSWARLDIVRSRTGGHWRCRAHSVAAAVEICRVVPAVALRHRRGCGRSFESVGRWVVELVVILAVRFVA